MVKYINESKCNVSMNYSSTRSVKAAPVEFSDALRNGLADDGGLYVPDTFPKIGIEEIKNLKDKSYGEITYSVLSGFVGDSISPDDLNESIKDAYGNNFNSGGDPAPLQRVGDNRHILELFHGPTMAFKDFAMQLLSRLMEKNLKKPVAILVATSGDTGAAAVASFKDIAQIDLFVLYPYGRVTEVHLDQMLKKGGGNTHILPINGSFDDCQAIVKKLFQDRQFRNQIDQHNLSGVNSVNWARVMAQTVYYFKAYLDLGCPECVNFAVPTGNFGDAYAGFVAKQMGLPISKIVIAVNDNNSLHHMLNDGIYQKRDVKQTMSLAMDIQIASNFERLLYEAVNRDGEVVRDLMTEWKNNGKFKVPDYAINFIRQTFDSGTATDDDVTKIIKSSSYENLDPHTAVAMHVINESKISKLEGPMVIVGTAHPDKTPVEMARIRGKPYVPQKVQESKPLENKTESVKKFIVDTLSHR